MHSYRIQLLLFSCFAFCQCQDNAETLFKRVDHPHSNVDFNNEITINDTLNILTTEFVYNGGGVATGDLNGDGLPDLFFTGNQVDNRLYLNKGEMKFQDVTVEAQVSKANDAWWSSGVNIVDVNTDGRNDLYICNTFQRNGDLRPNLLYINQGNNEQGIPSFLEAAQAYGVADTSHSSHAQFFDYDNDGDLDLFIGVNWIEGRYPNTFVPLKTDGSALNRDLLYRNDWSDSLGHPVFTDVSISAGLVQDGYSHSTLIHDFDGDGWQDIYVANDYFSNDLIFINNRDGTFQNRAGDIFKHFSLSAMGSDVADINNDGKADFFTSEMQPYYNKRKKLFQGESNYQNTINTIVHDYEFQYTRNTLQLNLGLNPRTNLPLFSEVGLYAGVMETDWSWAALFADFNNDGWKDLFISNGFPKDVTDRDFSDFRAEVGRLVTQEQLYAAIPEVKSPNFIFENQRDLTFENRAQEWGLKIPSFSYGAAYGDLDLDGDLDLVINNMNDTAFVFENRRAAQPDFNYLRIRLHGPPKNPAAIGATIRIDAQGETQVNSIISGRGYLSQSELVAHFGLSRPEAVDSVTVLWPDQTVSYMVDVAANQMLTIDYNTEVKHPRVFTRPKEESFFQDAAVDYQLLHKDQDRDYIDFNIQRTLPHKFSQYGPSISVGDVNGDGLDDVFIGAGRSRDEVLFIQKATGFSRKRLDLKLDPEKREEDAGSLLFDADQDGDLDLYVVRGSAQDPPHDPLYQDALYVNDGRGNFRHEAKALPIIHANGSCVKAADVDSDGDLDLFVGSRVLPRSYPLPDRSYLLLNESDSEGLSFRDVTADRAPDLLKPGLISDALWTDFNGDDQPDLILAGEWMPITFLANQEGKLENVTASTGVQDALGWWNSLSPADLDNDGDIDYIAGNYGQNLYFQCNSDQPLRIYAKDLDANGSIDPLISCYWLDSMGEYHEFLYHPRQDLIKQFVGIRKKYNTYGAFGEATVPEMFSHEEMADALILKANFLKSSIIENRGNGQFVLHPLPPMAQMAPIYGSMAMDINEDELLDIILVGNDHGMEVQQGRADALNGLVMVGTGDFTFKPLSPQKSNFMVPGDARALVMLNTEKDDLILASQNKDSLRVHKYKEAQKAKLVEVPDGVSKVQLTLAGGQTRLCEFPYGSSFMSHSSRSIRLNPTIKKLVFVNTRGETVKTLDANDLPL